MNGNQINLIHDHYYCAKKQMKIFKVGPTALIL